MAELLFVIPVAAGLDAVVVKRLILAGIGTGTKAGDDIIVGGVYQIIVKRSLQAGKIMAVGVAFYEDYVALVNFSDPVNRSVDDAVKGRIIGGKVFVHIKRIIAAAAAGAWLVEKFIASHGRTVFETGCDFLHQGVVSPLVTGIGPEQGDSAVVVAVPVGVLPALNRVHVKNDVKSVLFAEIYGLSEKAESLFPVDKGGIVGFEVPVVQRQTHDRSASGGYKGQVILRQEIANHFLKEVSSVLFSQSFFHMLAKRDLGSGETVDEILHVHPAAYTGTSQVNGRSGFCYNTLSPGFKEFHTV